MLPGACCPPCCPPRPKSANSRGVLSLPGASRRSLSAPTSYRFALGETRGRCAMAYEWELREQSPADAAHTVLLLPGGMCSAGSFAELMAEPALAGTRLVAATLPGQAGAPPPDDYSVESYARLVTELATKVGADVLVGFSMGACVAVEMITSGNFTGPVVLLGVSLSSKDEPAFFRGIVHLTRVLGSLPCTVLAKGAASMVKRTGLSAER